MLAGLLFAIHDADDRPDRLAATLPFSGVTLIEYQARLLIAAGVAQVIVVVARMTPELLGAINRIGRRGVSVDTVRSAAEAVEKLHPLARVLMLGDGLVTTDAIVKAMAAEEGDCLLVVPEADAGPGFERVGGQMAWAGVARLSASRIAEVAGLPQDYDLQSSLLRFAVQSRATQVLLPTDAVRGGHGIERQARTLEERGRAVLMTIVSGRRGWFDRFVLAPIARLALPLLVDRGAAGASVGGAGLALGVAGLVTIGFGLASTGLVIALIACVALALGSVLSDLRDEAPLARWQTLAIGGIAAASTLVFAFIVAGRAGENTALAIGTALIAIGGLAERAILERDRRLWWGSPAAYLLIVGAFALIGFPVFGLGFAVVYATATLADAIERLRRDP
ncbi:MULTISPECIES: hypothetical protein [unclassified Sphingomonas]|uniref:hypothetical protein n=1 Tax=unclassified Sphingomonas TaxID=196159 RepID=UPI0006FCFEBB|nr:MULTISPECIES: hypothetical protein [unclassified Sphingomonas]KQS51146.1 hypothetical protein ASG20_03525 [Sphingomonas sp. Leaf198]